MPDKGKAVAGFGIVVITIVIGIALVGAPVVQAGSNGAVIINQVTITNTGTVFRNSTTTETITQSVANTVTTFTTVTAALPANITLSGTARTQGIGTKAVSVQFTSSGGGIFGSNVVNGEYSLSLPNPGTYSVVIDYSGTPVGGSCSVGAFVLSTTGTTYKADLEC